MENNPIRVYAIDSPQPYMQLNYTLVCHSHLVHTIVTARPSVLRDWVKKVCYFHSHRLRDGGDMVMGLGVQWVYRSRGPRAATLQLCAGHYCLIFQLLHAPHSPAALHQLLSNENVIFVGLGTNGDANMLKDSRHRLSVSRLVDVRDMANDLRRCSKRASMKTLALEVLGMDGVEKPPPGRSKWDNKRLSDTQVEYACIDAFICLLMGEALDVWKW